MRKCCKLNIHYICNQQFYVRACKTRWKPHQQQHYTFILFAFIIITNLLLPLHDIKVIELNGDNNFKENFSVMPEKDSIECRNKIN